ncbi:hypothetical protein [Primorskyibacter sp. S87]|uniref:hypothetical protein n=1 Tax=Primorskyibacter sp. S87 TaxID=3415126 RepID=UPI003C7CD23E
MAPTIKPTCLLMTCAGILTFAASQAVAGDFARITSESEFNSLVVGKKLTLDENYVTVKKNGTLKGKFGGKTLKGNWAWRDGYWCRTLTTHSKNTDCQLWTVSGNQHKVTRDRGNGKTFTYVAN